jgi:hypothetical protein
MLHLSAGLSAMIAGATVVQAVRWLAGDDQIAIAAVLTRLVIAAFAAVLFEAIVGTMRVLAEIRDRLPPPQR